jgi:hypothetical protein
VEMTHHVIEREVLSSQACCRVQRKPNAAAVI